MNNPGEYNKSKITALNRRKLENESVKSFDVT